MNILCAADLADLKPIIIYQGDILKYTISNSRIFFNTIDDPFVIYELVGNSVVSFVNVPYWTNKKEQVSEFICCGDMLYILTQDFLLGYAIKEDYMKLGITGHYSNLYTDEKTLYFSDSENNNLYRLSGDFKIQKLNDLYCTFYSVYGDVAYFANWKDQGKLYKTDLVTLKSEKVLDDIVGDIYVYKNNIWYISEINNYNLCRFNLTKNDVTAFDLNLFEAAGKEDVLYITVQGKGGVYKLIEKNLEKVISDEAISLIISNDKLYYLIDKSSNISEEDLPF